MQKPTKKPGNRIEIVQKKKSAPIPVSKGIGLVAKTSFDERKKQLSSAPRHIVVTKAVPVAAAAAAAAVPEVHDAPKPMRIDLFPWQFEKQRKGIILRDDWNKLVTKIQKAVDSEAEKENERLHAELHKALNIIDELKSKINTMRKSVSQFTRAFEAEHGA